MSSSAARVMVDIGAGDLKCFPSLACVDVGAETGSGELIEEVRWHAQSEHYCEQKQNEQYPARGMLKPKSVQE